MWESYTLIETDKASGLDAMKYIKYILSEFVAENQDGSLCAHIPVAWIKINPTKQLSEGQRRDSAEIVLNAL